MIVSSRLQPDQKRVKQAASSLDPATPTAKEDASKEGKTTTHLEPEMAPSVSEGEELTPEEVQLVSQYILLDTNHHHQQQQQQQQQQALYGIAKAIL